MYTDGSSDVSFKNGGVFTQQFNGENTRKCTSSGSICSNYTTELKAIRTALQEINRAEIEVDVVITVELQVVVLGYFRRNQTAFNNAIQKETWRIRKQGNKLTFQQLPSYADVHESVVADDLAKIRRLETQVGMTTSMILSPYQGKCQLTSIILRV